MDYLYFFSYNIIGKCCIFIITSKLSLLLHYKFELTVFKKFVRLRTNCDIDYIWPGVADRVKGFVVDPAIKKRVLQFNRIRGELLLEYCETTDF